jgi:hypothetical protein
MAKEMLNFAYEVSLSYLYGYLTCRKILRHSTDSVTSPSKEGVLRIFIALNNPIILGPVKTNVY